MQASAQHVPHQSAVPSVLHPAACPPAVTNRPPKLHIADDPRSSSIALDGTAAAVRSVLGGPLRRPRFGQLGYGALAAAAASGADAARILAPAGGEWSTAGRTHVYVGVQPGAAAEWHQVGVWRPGVACWMRGRRGHA